MTTSVAGIDLPPKHARQTAAVVSVAEQCQCEACCGSHRDSGWDRTSLIAAVATIIHREQLPPEVRHAALTLVGWLARRHNGEKACNRGVSQARKQSIRVHDGRG